MSGRVALKRSLSLPLLVLYGLGTTIGAGIYALVGEIAAAAGYLAPFSFLLAALLAGLTAAGFAELGARLPRAAGEALYVRAGLGSRRLSTVTGLLVVLAGLVSAAAMINGFVGYLHEFVQVDRVSAIVAVTLALGAAAAWGIAESVVIASLLTLVEVAGLVWVIVAGAAASGPAPHWTALVPLNTTDWGAALGTALLAFYAFIGFEDMVNVAEEVRDVRRTLPLAILLTLVLTTLLYVLLMLVAVFALPPGELAASRAPLAYLYQQVTGRSAAVISLIGMFAIVNGALIQIVMAARVLYGLSGMAQLPALLGRVSARTRTPLVATGLVTILVLVLAVTGRLAGLAQTTSVTMLVVFALVNLALWRIKRRQPDAPGTPALPLWVPLAAFLVCVGFVASEALRLASGW